MLRSPSMMGMTSTNWRRRWSYCAATRRGGENWLPTHWSTLESKVGTAKKKFTSPLSTLWPLAGHLRPHRSARNPGPNVRPELSSRISDLKIGDNDVEDRHRLRSCVSRAHGNLPEVDTQ